MAKKAYGKLIRRIRKFIKEYEGQYSQSQLLKDTSNHGVINDIKTIANAEKQHGLSWETFVVLSSTLSARLKEVRRTHLVHGQFDFLKDPGFAWLIDRLLRDIDPVLEPEHLIMNHETKYLIESYDLSLTVHPQPGGIVDIFRSGQSSEKFAYDNLAVSRSVVRFSEDNQRMEPGFKLKYGTTLGRLKLMEPGVDQIVDDPAYRLHKTSVAYLPDPRDGMAHRMEVMVYGGFGEGNETTHYSMAQSAIYQNVTFSLDLTAYREEVFRKLPELIMVPVLTDRPFDCCDIARKGMGLPIVPDEQTGLAFKWRFHDLINVMICVRWETDRNRVPSGF